jgi:esterase/lipase superfamily enzyme
MLIITNRAPATNPTDGNAFTSKFAVGKTDLSVADATRLSIGNGPAAWKTKNVDVNTSDIAISKRLAEHMSAAKLNGRRILFYVHGNSNDYLKMLERCYDLTSAYEAIEVIGFSWPSEGFLPSQKKFMSAFDRDMGADDGLDSQSKFQNWMMDTQREYRPVF